MWTEPSKAKEGVSSYDHVILETPLGRAIIEWKSWKESPSYELTLGDTWIGVEYDLDAAKLLLLTHLTAKYNELGGFIATNYFNASLYIVNEKSDNNGRKL